MYSLAALMSSQGAARTIEMLNEYNVGPTIANRYPGREGKVIGSNEALLER